MDKKDNIFRFKEFPVYIDARNFRKELKEYTKKNFPKMEMHILTSQLWRALDSVLLNIAEGSERYSDIDFSRFLNNSITSLNEVVSCLDLAYDDGYLDKVYYDKFVNSSKGVYKQLRAFSSKVRKDNMRN